MPGRLPDLLFGDGRAADVLGGRRRHVDGRVSDEDESELEWYEKLLELDRRHEEFEREREARRQAEQEAATAPQTTASIVREAISASTGSSGHIPLNGTAVLKAALAGMGTNGTINGGAAE